MAYALITKLPPQMGLYSAIVGVIVGALWGSSAQMQTGLTNATSLLVLSVLLGVASPFLDLGKRDQDPSRDLRGALAR